MRRIRRKSRKLPLPIGVKECQMGPINKSREDKETGRVEAFSDGIFAIAITLLVLNLKVPAFESLAGQSLESFLFAQWPVFLAYLLSFATILIMWVNHHHLFSMIRRIDNTFLFINGGLLLVVSFAPYPTSLLAEHIQHDYAVLAMAFYAGMSLLAAIFYNLLWNYASRGNRLLASNVDKNMVEAVNKQYRFGPHIYVVAFMFSFINVWISLLICLLLAIFWAFIGIFGKPEGKARADYQPSQKAV